MLNKRAATDDTDVPLSLSDLKDLRLIVDVSLDSHPAVRDVTDDDTRILSSHLATLISSASASASSARPRLGRTPTVHLGAKHARDLASIVLSVCVEGVMWFPTLLERDISDDRVTDLCDRLWRAIDP